MSLPVAIYSLRVPPGGQVFPAVPLGIGASFRVTMAAIDPTETPVREDVDDTSEPFAVLKMSRILSGLDDDEDFEDDDMDSDEDSEEDEGLNGGPSNLKIAKSLKKKALLEALAAEDEDEDMEDDSENDSGDDSGDEAEAQQVLAKLQEALKEDKGKGKAAADDDDDSDDDSESLEISESVVCTLNRTNFPQQVLDFTVGARDQVFFKVVGNFAVYLTGNYIMPPDADDEHDLEPDSDEELDELDGLDDLVGDSDSEIDELDDLEDPRIAEIDDEEELDMKKLIKQAGELKKGKNKRPAEDSDDDEPALDDMISKSLKQEGAKKEAAPAAAAEPTTNGETKKLSKSEKKRLKKLKNNEGAAADAPAPAAATPETNGTKDKKVQFAKELEQGPTPSPSTTAKPKAATPAASASAPSTRTVQGITVDDRKVGNGPAAKKGSTLSMRYIGKLDSGKVFDSNKSGKPFSFKLGKGEVIKGWDIGLEGLQNGGERRIKIPANLAYGKKGAPPDIPPNSALTFDVKCVGVK